MNLKAINAPVGKYSDLKNILVRLGWLIVVIPSIVFSVFTTKQVVSVDSLEISKWVYGYLNFGTFILGVILAIIIVWRKPKDWLAVTVSLMLVTWTSTGSGSEFWIATGIGGSDWNWLIAYFLSAPYEVLLSILLLAVLLVFPDGKWTPKWTRWLFIFSLIGAFLLPIYWCAIVLIMVFAPESNLNLDALLGTIPAIFRLGVLVLGSLMQIYRLSTTRDPLQRQQLKWIAFSLIGMTLLYVLLNLAWRLTSWDKDSPQLLTLFLTLLLFTYSFIVTFAISILRYRIWDIDIVINKAIVYSVLTAILGSLGIVGTVVFDYYSKSFLEDSPVSGLLVILPILILFSPLQTAVQSFVDRRFKPEEIDFSGTIVEFSPDAQLMLSSGDILKILVHQTKEQLNVSEAAIFLRHENVGLVLSEPLSAEDSTSLLELPAKELAFLEKGEVVIPVDTSHFSLYLPLTLRRASRPGFLGVLALGARENGVGYSSSVITSLQKFGADAGKVLYVAKLRESSGKNIMERLASIEVGLAKLKPGLN